MLLSYFLSNSKAIFMDKKFLSTSKAFLRLGLSFTTPHSCTSPLASNMYMIVPHTKTTAAT